MKEKQHDYEREARVSSRPDSLEIFKLDGLFKLDFLLMTKFFKKCLKKHVSLRHNIAWTFSRESYNLRINKILPCQVSVNYYTFTC